MGWVPKFGATEQRLAVELYRLLARGIPVSVERPANAVSLEENTISKIMAPWRDVFRDDEGHVTGFRGLSLCETRHHIEAGGRTTYTWCAFDTLFIPGIQRKTVRIQSTSPVTGQPIRLTVTPRRIKQVDPPGTVMSFVLPEGNAAKDDIIAHFCRHVYFFESAEAASAWAGKTNGAFLLSMADAFALARRRNATPFSHVLA